MRKNMKKKIKLLGLMTVLALSFSCAQSNADNTPGPPASVSDVGIVVYVFGDKRTNGARLVQGSDPVVQAEEGKELVFLVTTNIVGPPISVMYDVSTGSGSNAARGISVCSTGYDYENIPPGTNTATKGLTFHFQTFICPDDDVELEEEFQVKLLSGADGVENSPFKINVTIPNYDKALVGVRNINQLETAGTANIEITLRNVDMPIPPGLTIEYEIRGVTRDGVDSVEPEDFVLAVPTDPPSFPKGRKAFPGVNTNDVMPMVSVPIQFTQDGDSDDEEFEIFISLADTNSEGILNLTALANDRASGFILAPVVDPNAPPPPVGCEKSSTKRHPEAIPIYNLAQLQAINVNDDTRKRHYILMNNIDAANTEKWNGGLGFQPIGRLITRCGANGTDQNYRTRMPFTGSFDGNGHIISNLHINRPRQDFVGLFGAIDNAQICRLGLVNAKITGWGFIGGIAGFASLSGERQDEDLIRKTFVTGTVTAGHGVIGGLVGTHGRGSIRRSYSTAAITGPAGYAGGLVGDQSNGSSAVVNSYAAGDVSGGGVVGGLVADAFSKIRNSYSTGLVDGAGFTGGLAGINWYRVANSYSASLFSDRGRKGGLIGWNANKRGRLINGKNYFLSDIGGSDGINSYGYDWLQYELTGCPADRCIIAPGNTDEERRNFLLTELDETAMGWDANVWGRLNSSTHFPCIKGLPIYDNSGMLGDKDACQ